MPYKQILFGTDGSATAELAQHTATYLADRLGARLHIVSAHPRDAAPDQTERMLEPARQLAMGAGVGATTAAVAGEPAAAVVAEAKAMPADLIVVGDKGMGAPKRLRLGGVPDRIVHNTPCDVLIVRSSSRVETHERPAYRRILIGTDGSVTAFHAARRGFDLATLLGAAPAVVLVGPPDPGERIVGQTVEQLAGAVDVETFVLPGDPADQICEIARQRRFDLVVVGNRGMSGASRFFLGSVPDKVAHSASTDTLIVQTTARRLEDLAPGEGGVVFIEQAAVAAYKSPTGETHLLSPRCRHMGCTVVWNALERTWDCPCHGSRYGFDGSLLSGPARRGLSKFQGATPGRGGVPKGSR
jgi:nucleotide-binding universal stress UspA family protein/nitrite reductase/ring-hydroxylating ferredoxin subunit